MTMFRTLCDLVVQIRIEPVDSYHIWCDLKPAIKDTCVTDTGSAISWLYQAVRETTGLSHRSLQTWSWCTRPGEFHLQPEFEGMAQLDDAFEQVSSKEDPAKSFHHAVNSKVSNI